MLGCRAGAGLGEKPEDVLQGVWPLFVHPRLSSTRALELFRNQVRLPAQNRDRIGILSRQATGMRALSSPATVFGSQAGTV